MTARQLTYRPRHRTGEVPVSNVIQAGKRFLAHRPTTTKVSASIIRPDFEAGYWTPEKLHHTFAPSLKQLPFVMVKGGRQRPSAATYWNDAPTGNGRNDFKRGKTYAALTIRAMTADGCPWYLEKVTKAIVIDSASRRARGGKHSRALPPAVDGFIHELSRQFCATIIGIEPAS
jgi:hypothetical protein